MFSLLEKERNPGIKPHDKMSEFLCILSIFIVAIVLSASGCLEKKNLEPEKPLAENELFKYRYENKYYSKQCDIITVKDGRGNTHEYLDYWVGTGNGGGSITHYPDCKYCLEKNNVKH